MQILVLDTIHGGKTIGAALSARGDSVDLVDVYRGWESTVSARDAQEKTYDLIVAPVHLDPDYPHLRFFRKRGTKIISHHEAVRMLLGNCLPRPMIEITGARGKTTTAHALASLMNGAGILHTSAGTYRYPERELLARTGITPASILAAAAAAIQCHGWLIAEVSLGVTGAGSLAIITSGEDYPFAAGKKKALATKIASARHARKVLLGEGIELDDELFEPRDVVRLDEVARVEGSTALLGAGRGARFTSPLLELKAYREPLLLAGTAAVMLGCDPKKLSSFTALPGRMAEVRVGDSGNILVIDNANSGTNAVTTIEAARYARARSGNEELTLVIGQAEGDGKVCENFPTDQIRLALDAIRPARIVLVGPESYPQDQHSAGWEPLIAARAATLEEGYFAALAKTQSGSVVLAVKTWR
ncbi:MAG: coenzyme F430 synthase [Methanoregula sp.]|nr:coenzyme F430 synthase [Methanoregula sp.]